jgi:hypothetical protein
MLNLNSSYPSKSNIPDSDYLYGSSRDVSIPNDGSGTPHAADIRKDTDGFFQALLYNATITPSDSSETTYNSQLFRAVQKVIALMSEKYVNTPLGKDNLSDRIGGIQNDDNILAPPYAESNRVTTYDWRNCFRGWHADLAQETVFMIRDDHATSIYEYRNDKRNFGIEFNTRSITLPANHVPDSGCCDGAHVYLLCHTAATGTACAVHKFNINPWSATPVWSSTLTGAISDNRDGDTIIRVADDNNVAVLFNGATLSTGVDALAVIAKSTGTATYGSGNHSAGSIEGGAGMCIAAGSIWFTTRTSGFESSYLNGAQITSPTSAPSSQPSPITYSGSFGRIESNGTLIAVPTINSGTGLASVSIFNVEGGSDMDSYESYYRFFNADHTDNYPSIAWDGCRMWTLWNEATSNNNSFLAPVDLSDFYSADTGSWIINKPYTFIGAPQSVAAVTDKTRMCYSDGCLWIIPDANDNLFQRVPRLITRY